MVRMRLRKLSSLSLGVIISLILALFPVPAQATTITSFSNWNGVTTYIPDPSDVDNNPQVDLARVWFTSDSTYNTEPATSSLAGGLTQLTWSGLNTAVAAGDTATISFQATPTGTPGTYYNDASFTANVVGGSSTFDTATRRP